MDPDYSEIFGLLVRVLGLLLSWGGIVLVTGSFLLDAFFQGIYFGVGLSACVIGLLIMRFAGLVVKFAYHK
ncbi:MAG TPA: hypothetical protein VNQ76_05880 [Planctomicrobium sp.]|nr:hypothetical protein [Planctomicrobium sp.]